MSLREKNTQRRERYAEIEKEIERYKRQIVGFKRDKEEMRERVEVEEAAL